VLQAAGGTGLAGWAVEIRARDAATMQLCLALPGWRLKIPQGAGVIIAVTGQADAIRRQIVPLLAGHLARLATDAQHRIGKESV
jgi:hypothetical protein